MQEVSAKGWVSDTCTAAPLKYYSCAYTCAFVFCVVVGVSVRPRHHHGERAQGRRGDRGGRSLLRGLLHERGMRCQALRWVLDDVLWWRGYVQHDVKGMSSAESAILGALCHQYVLTAVGSWAGYFVLPAVGQAAQVVHTA